MTAPLTEGARYTVGPDPRYGDGSMNTTVKSGDRVVVTRATVDSDGDVFIRTDSGVGTYLTPASLIQVGVSVEALSGALVALGLTATVAAEKIIAVAQAIDEAKS